jgi:predicted MFS family arabinose efflux permease
MPRGNTQHLTPALTLLMAVASGLGVANLYYCQPLLADMGRDFHVSIGQVGLIPMFTQLGYALGMLLFVPLGDMLERRRLIVIMLFAVAGALLAVAFSPAFWFLVTFSFLLGLTTIVPQLIVPFAAAMAEPKQRGKAVGTVMSGLLVGILLARTVSGVVGAHLGWRWMYVIAAAIMICLAMVLALSLPKSTPSFAGSYRELMSSLIGLIREQPVLREAALTGAMLFAAFSAFWTTLVFFVEEPPYHYGSQEAGLFGLVGAAGALGASLAGRKADRDTPRAVLGPAIIITIVSFGLFWLVGHYLFGLILGVILLDLGVQSGQVSNQTRIYSLSSNAQNRLNTIYMTTYFIGGALGSSAGAWSWHLAGWTGVCITGMAFSFVALFVFAAGSTARKAIVVE